jgi:hypothetical protein
MGQICNILRHGKGTCLDPLQVGLAGRLMTASRKAERLSGVGLAETVARGFPLVEGCPIRGKPEKWAFCEICVLESF